MITVSVFSKGRTGLAGFVPLKEYTFEDSEREEAHKVMKSIDTDEHDIIVVYRGIDQELIAKLQMSPIFDLMKPEFAPFEGNRAEYHGEA